MEELVSVDSVSIYSVINRNHGEPEQFTTKENLKLQAIVNDLEVEVGKVEITEVFTERAVNNRYSLHDVYDSTGEYFSIYESVVEHGEAIIVNDELDWSLYESIHNDHVYLLDKLFIYQEFRNKGFGTSFIQDYMDRTSSRHSDDVLFLLEAFPFHLKDKYAEDSEENNSLIEIETKKLISLYQRWGFKTLSADLSVMYKYGSLGT